MARDYRTTGASGSSLRVPGAAGKCCAISRANHDGTKEKGYFLCTASAGGIQREFVEVKPA